MSEKFDNSALLVRLEEIAVTAGQMAMAYFRPGEHTSADVQSKEGGSPVTEADHLVDRFLHDTLRPLLPQAGWLSEETADTAERLDRDLVFVVDPIDGTKSFITGKPLWGTLVALLHRGEPVLGLIDQPVLRERWLGLKGSRTTFNGAEVSTRPCARLADAYLYATTPHMFADGEIEKAWARVRDEVRIPLYGCDCYAYGLLALGHADLVVEADLGPYDYLAIAPVVAGAGGKMTDWRGAELRANYDAVSRRHSVEGLAREVVAAGDLATHAAALEKLAWK